MKLTLTAAEIMRALQVYVAAKTGASARDCDVRLYPRARDGLYAVVTVLKPAPVLTERVEDL